MDFKKKTWEIEIGDTELLVPFEFYTVKSPSLNGAKREALKLAKNIPLLKDALAKGKLKWDTPSEYRDANIPVVDRVVRGQVSSLYVHITLLDQPKPVTLVETKITRAVIAAVVFASILMTVFIVWHSRSGDELRNIMTSVHPEYGKRVLRICDKYETIIDYKKLGFIVRDFNRDVLKYERTYTLPKDYDNMIRLITENKYSLEFSFLIKTPQHPSYNKEN